MSSTAEMIEVLCVRCGEQYAGWDQSLLDAPEKSACPYCGHDPMLDRLLHEEGVMVLGGEEEDAPAV